MENAVQRAVALGEGEAVEPEQLPDSIYASGDHSARKADRFSLIEAKRRAVEQTERRVVINCLQATNGHISNAAQLANFDVSNFHKLIKKLDLDPNDFK